MTVAANEMPIGLSIRPTLTERRYRPALPIKDPKSTIFNPPLFH
jgi:hypothetical protein